MDGEPFRNEYLTSSQWSGTAPGSINYTGGNVGIGTASPQTPLQIIAPEGGPGSGNAAYGLLVTAGSGNRAVNIGTNGTVGWIQSAYTNNIGIGNILALNPNGGNVGIGTVSPGYTLDINSTTGINLYSTNTTTPLFKMVTFGNHTSSTFWSEDWDGTAGGPGSSLFTMDHSTGQGLYNLLAGGYNEANTFKYGSTRGACRISMGDATFGLSLSSLSSGATKGSAMTLYNSITSDTNTIILYTNAGTERLRVDSSGNVGIGKTPVYKLDVTGGYIRQNQRDYGYLIALDGATWDNSRWWMDGASTYLDFGGMESGFKIRGNNDNTNAFGSQTYTEQLKIQARSGTGMSFGTGGVAFAMAGWSADRVWDNYPCISVFNTAGNGATLQGEFRVHGAAMSYASYPDASGADFSVNFRIDGGTYFTSDRRAKSNITSITDALDTVMKLDGKRFQRINSDGIVQEHVSENTYKFGFIAQDLQDAKIDELYLHYPNEDDGTDNFNNSYSVDYASLVAVLTNAIKEQQGMIVDLQNRLAAAGL